MCCSKIFK